MLNPGSWVAMIAHKYMHKYGVEREDLGRVAISQRNHAQSNPCLLYTSDAADERSSVDLGGRRIIKKKKPRDHKTLQSIQ